MKKVYLFVIILFSFLQVSMGENNPLWMRYPSISPDGKNIAFSFQGDIFIVPSQGGTARHLTVHKAYDFMPVWSPDSKNIAFASDRFGNFDVFVIPVEGGNPQRLTYYSSNETPNSFTPDGKYILFSATIQDTPENAQFPSGILSELYKVPVKGGRVSQILTTPAEKAVYDKKMQHILYQDRKGYENIWRKHHTSSVTRDIWLYSVKTGKSKKLSRFNGEDRNPVYGPDQKTVYYISEQFGAFNVCKFPLSNPDKVSQLTFFKRNPVRFLSAGNNGLLCFGYNGEIYTLVPGEKPKKVNVNLRVDEKENPVEFMTLTSHASEMAVSPSGKEVAFIVRGDVFVTSTNYSTTKRITNTPEQERSVSFSPDGKRLLYASERAKSWNIYQTKLVRPEEELFALSTVLKEEPVVVNKEETFQPLYSPDGKEVAYLENRTALKVINLATKKSRLVLSGKYNYSYSDGDQWYQWSPDGKWFLVQFSPHNLFMNDVALVSAAGGDNPINLTNSGYNDSRPKWILNGNGMIWGSDMQGLRSHGSWGATRDIYALFFNQKSFDRFKMSKEEYDLLKAKEKEARKKKSKTNPTKKVITPVTFDLKNIDDRRVRLTINSSNISDAILTPDGEKLYYLAKFEKGYDLWVNNLRTKQTKLALKLRGGGGAMQLDKSGKNLFLMSGGKIMKIAITGKPMPKVISYRAELNINKAKEREYMFDHVWREAKEKFYRPDLAGVDWKYYGDEYRRYVPFITNNYDYAEMLSEMLGELNGSHTGAGYRHRDPKGDQTAKLGVFIDWNYKGKGAKILEVIEKGPLQKAGSKIKAGDILEKIDGVVIDKNENYYRFLNHKAGKNTLLSMYDPKTGKRWEETVKPTSIRKESGLLYDRWVKLRTEEAKKLSDGKIGYVHIRGMNSASFRKFYSELLGRDYNKKAIIVDTRFNGGGWLHDDLVTILSGKKYVEFYPHGRYYGYEPINKWVKPSAVLISESNYSDAHGFPYAYKTLKIGKLVGMPVPGTMTAVWWETLQDPTLYFGIPEVGTKNLKGHYLENTQLEPDVKIRQDFSVVSHGKDQQLEKAVQVLLKETSANN